MLLDVFALIINGKRCTRFYHLWWVVGPSMKLTRVPCRNFRGKEDKYARRLTYTRLYIFFTYIAEVCISLSSCLSEIFGLLKCQQQQKFFMADVVRPRPAVFRGNRVTFNIAYMTVFNTETNSVHALVVFIFFVLLGFLQIRYAQNPNPFLLHPKTIWLSVATFLLYCLAFLGTLNFGIRIHHLRTLMHAFASLSLISLLLLLLPDTWESLRFSVYTLWFVIHLFIIFRSRFRDTWLQRQRRGTHPLLPITSMDFN
ncbi:hypothetical protein VIGAN_09162500 [Vigna angularis var. angularis]|uniref:Uncharacterized protein n=1 Tax=Vigna angularis var. angularis TaxID=157739 RepID=A0A0S3SYQ3_PHAAN|nr:hypothetical protein VIGAN_09162500 [Vigna angularis var. angularis]